MGDDLQALKQLMPVETEQFKLGVLKRSIEPLDHLIEVTLQKPHADDILGITCSRGHVIIRLERGSIAEQCGQLSVGDKLITVNGFSCDTENDILSVLESDGIDSFDLEVQKYVWARGLRR